MFLVNQVFEGMFMSLWYATENEDVAGRRLQVASFFLAAVGGQRSAVYFQGRNL
jgi:hypothetical protein